MRKLKGFERTYLRGLAHSLKPVVQIGKNGLKNEVVGSIEEAFSTRELIKIKFNEFKEEKKTISKEIEEITGSEMVGMIGNIAIFFKENDDETKRRIKLPAKVTSRGIHKSKQ
ncbi:MAG TPA: YhbY family RNA-binding protein [Desulfomonilia bacterium]|jgi:RNA-binding protein